MTQKKRIKKINSCIHLDDLLRAEKKVISRHIDEHKHFQHMENENEAVMDFIEKYDWIMRELYCGYGCKDRYDCKLAKDYVNGDNNRKKERKDKLFKGYL